MVDCYIHDSRHLYKWDMEIDEDYKVTFSFSFFEFEKNTYIFLTKFPRIDFEKNAYILWKNSIERLNLTRGIRQRAKGQRLNWLYIQATELLIKRPIKSSRKAVIEFIVWIIKIWAKMSIWPFRPKQVAKCYLFKKKITCLKKKNYMELKFHVTFCK